MSAVMTPEGAPAFVSTRGQAPAVSIDTALVAGLAPDGGLYVPAKLPAPRWEIDALAGASLAEGGEQVLAPFFVGSRLRDALGNQLVSELLVKTVARRGYMLAVGKDAIRMV